MSLALTQFNDALAENSWSSSFTTHLSLAQNSPNAVNNWLHAVRCHLSYVLLNHLRLNMPPQIYDHGAIISSLAAIASSIARHYPSVGQETTLD